MKLRQLYASILGTIALALSLGAVPAVGLAATAPPACDGSQLTITGGINCAAPKSASGAELFGSGDNLFKRIANLLIFLIGAIAVIMVIIGGLRYALSGGSPQATAGAKDTILYAVIGVVVAGLAFAIVNFVVGKF